MLYIADWQNVHTHTHTYWWGRGIFFLTRITLCANINNEHSIVGHLENAEKHKEENKLPVMFLHLDIYFTNFLLPRSSHSPLSFYFAYLCCIMPIFKNVVRINFGNLSFHLVLEYEHFPINY